MNPTLWKFLNIKCKQFNNKNEAYMYSIVYILGCFNFSAFAVLYLGIQINDRNGIPMLQHETMIFLSIVMCVFVFLGGALVLNTYFYIEDLIQEYKDFASKEARK